MGDRVALCVDELTCQNPGLIGLDGELFEAQGWLEVFASGGQARQAIRETQGIVEAWVASCEDVEPINLAATLKEDRPELRVQLVVPQGDGSLLSRAYTAGIDEVIDHGKFIRRYADRKARFHEEAPVAQPQEAGPVAQPQEVSPVAQPQEASPVVQLVPDAVELPIEVKTIETAPIATTSMVAPRAIVANNSRGFVMPVVSGSGGAGKSSVSVLAALIARDMGYRTLLLDYDLQFGDVAIMLGLAEPLTIDSVIARPELLDQEIRKDPTFTALAAPNRLEAAEGVVRSLPTLLERAASAYDVIIANTGAAWAEQHAALLERSYTSLFLIDQRVSSIRACKHALELCARCGIATGPFEFAVNRCVKGAPLTAADVSSALQGAPVFEIKDGGREVEDYLGAGGAVELLNSGNDFGESLRQMLARLLPNGDSSSTQDGRFAGDRRQAKRRAFHMGRKRGK